MKRLKGIFTVMLSAALLLAGCGAHQGQNGYQGDYLANDVREYPVGTHKAVVKDTNKVVCENGNAAYKIFVPESLSYYEAMALSELTHFLTLSTGCNFETVTKSERGAFNEEEKYISLGQNDWFTTSGVVTDLSTLKSTGYRLLSKGNTMFILGSSTGFGIVNGVYGLLEYLIDWHAYATDEVFYSKKDKITAKELDVTEIPAIETIFRHNTGYDQGIDLVRMHISDSTLSDFGHNIEGKWITQEDMQKHPDWVPDHQPCYSNPDVSDSVSQRVFDYLMADESVGWVFLGQSDNVNKCMCDRCEEERERYGPQESALLIRFMNRVARKTDEKLVAAGDTRKIQYATYAYQNTVDPPVKKAEDGSFVPNDPSVVPDENVAVMFTPIGAQYNVSFLDERNSYTKDALDRWRSIITIMWAYTYGVNYKDYFVGLNNFGAMQENLQVLASAGVSVSYMQGKFGGKVHGGPNFTPLREYLNAQLSWNPYADFNDLINDFMSHYYGPAANALTDYYKLYRAHYAYLESELGVDGWIYKEFTSEHWDNMYLTKAEGYLSDAYAAIEPLKETDHERWQEYSDRINLESMHYRYLRLRYHSNLYSLSERKEMIDGFESDCVKYGFDQYAEGFLMTNLIANWRVDL